jgi:RND family efflux transporter MFP subunit
MSSFQQKSQSSIQSGTEKFWKLPKSLQLIFWLLLIVVGILIYRSGGKQEPITTALPTERLVTLARVRDLSAQEVPLPLLGTVTSRSEATIRAEAGGKILLVDRKLGDYVPAGAVIAEFENSAERAQVLQAEGAYESASTGKDIASISRGSTDTSLGEAKNTAQNVISSTYTTLDDAIRTKTDPAWRNPETINAKLAVSVPDAKLVIALEAERTAIETMLRARDQRNKTLSPSSDLVSELSLVESETNIVKNYLDDLSLAFNHALPDNNASIPAIEGYKANAAVARGVVGSALTLITNTRNALSQSLAAQKIAEKNSSASESTRNTADASIKSALGNLRGAQSRLEKTIIRSPITGTINSLSIHTGDFVSPYSPVAVVSNNGALEIVAFVTEDDARELAIGGKVSIEGGGGGTITRIAPAIDPATRKIEVRIGLPSGTMGLTNGASVRLTAARAVKALSSETRIPKIPLSSLKITPDGAIVFTVSASSTLVAHTITMGALLGTDIEIPDGLTPDMEIVTDARGLESGRHVTVK